jgi:hypothetical protein
MSTFSFLSNSAAEKAREIEKFSAELMGQAGATIPQAATLRGDALLDELDAIESGARHLDAASESFIGASRQMRLLTHRLLESLPEVAAIGLSGQGESRVVAVMVGRTMPVDRAIALATGNAPAEGKTRRADIRHAAMLGMKTNLTRAAANAAAREWQPRLARLGCRRALAVTDLSWDERIFGLFRRSHVVERRPFSLPLPPWPTHPMAWHYSYRSWHRHARDLELLGPTPGIAQFGQVDAELRAWSLAYEHLDRGGMIILPEASVLPSLLS